MSLILKSSYIHPEDSKKNFNYNPFNKKMLSRFEITQSIRIFLYPTNSFSLRDQPRYLLTLFWSTMKIVTRFLHRRNRSIAIQILLKLLFTLLYFFLFFFIKVEKYYPICRGQKVNIERGMYRYTEQSL